MDDLVEKLRKANRTDIRGDSLDGEAADEIERLHDLHLERTHLTTKVIQQRDKARELLADCVGNHGVLFPEECAKCRAMIYLQGQDYADTQD